MLGAPKVKAIRGFSDFGFSYVYVIFEDGTDIYWARSRTLEYLSKILPRLPQGVNTELGPGRHRRGLGLSVRPGGQDRARTTWPNCGVSRTGIFATNCSRSRRGRGGSIGGFQKQYQVNVDPNKLLAFNIPISTVVQAIRDGNNDVGGRLVEFSGAEYMVRGRGYVEARPGHRTDRRRDGQAGNARPASRTSAPSPWTGNPPRNRRPRRRRRHGRRHRHHAPGENALNVIERVKAQARGNQAVAAQRRRDRHHLRPLEADRAVDRHAQGRAADRDRHRQPGDPDFPLAHPVARSSPSSRSPSPSCWCSFRSTSWA